jgi:CheY-like chemotaxis protein
VASGSEPAALVADDDADIRELAVSVLESIGCAVVAAGDGLAALELAAQSPPALAVLDIRMPKLDGLEVTRRLKADPATSAVPVIVVSASVSDQQQQAAVDAGADAFLAKPFRVAELRAVARRLLRPTAGQA